MISKEQAQNVQQKLLQLHPYLTLGLGKRGEDWTVEVRSSDGLTIKLPASLDGVAIQVRQTGPITPVTE